jgi:hypothetical protein
MPGNESTPGQLTPLNSGLLGPYLLRNDILPQPVIDLDQGQVDASGQLHPGLSLKVKDIIARAPLTKSSE